MLIPAMLMKQEIETEFANIAYTKKRMYYDGCIDNYTVEIKEEAEKYQFAIVAPKKYEKGYILVGFISFRVHFYDSCARNFGLIRFRDDYYDPCNMENVSYTPVVADAIRQIIRMIKGMHLHRIDFRCVGGNPAGKKYSRLLDNKLITDQYNTRVIWLMDTFKDANGQYHDTFIYELITKDGDPDA